MSGIIVNADTANPVGGSELELAADLRLAVTRLARVLRQRADVGVTPSMLSALINVERLGPVTLGKLAAAEQVQPPSLTAIVGRLEEAGLVARTADPTDRRFASVRITAEGKRLLERSRSRKTAYLSRALRSMDPAEREVLRRAIPLLAGLSKDES